MLEPGCSVDLLFCPFRRDGRPVYFRDGKSRDCRQRFRGIRFALTADQFVRLFDKPPDLVFAEGGLEVRKLPRSLRFGFGGHFRVGSQRDQSDMRIIQQIFADHPLKRAAGDLFSDFIVQAFVAQTFEGVVAVQPGFHHFKPQQQSLRRGSRFASERFQRLEFGRVDSRIDIDGIKTLFGESGKRIVDDPEKFVGPVRAGVFQLDRKDRLKQRRREAVIDVLRDPRVQQCFLQRRRVGIHQRVAQDLEHQAVVKRETGRKHPVQGQVVQIVPGLFGHGILEARAFHAVKGRLDRNFRVRFDPVKFPQPRIEIFELFVEIDIAVQVDPRIGRMVAARMEIPEGLIGQIRNVFGISA